MPLLARHTVKHRDVLRDVRPAGQRIFDFWSKTDTLAMSAWFVASFLIFQPDFAGWSDIVMVVFLFYFRWSTAIPFRLPFKMPMNANMPDRHNPSPGKKGAGKSEGILYLGNLDEADNADHGRELWLTNSDARTHILFLGTTGSGKTEGLKSLVANSLSWGSGFVYVDGKADTDLWASLYALARRFGRDDDLLILNYMTANSDNGAMSNTMNPFSNGSASYLTNMVTSLMPDAGGDNAMWKERAVALLGALMPALTWLRDKTGKLLDVGVLREYIELPAIIRLSRDENLAPRILKGLKGYLNTLPGYVDDAFNDDGTEKPPSPDQPMYDLQVARQQHGYLSMQFTRSLQSLADEYGYIFKAELADIDVLDVVLNRRILVALIPSLEKSGDEAANLGKIIAASLKGMMGATLGNTVEGTWENAIGSKQTRSNASFMTVFDEVGYYTAQGMAVMAAQARSLGFSLIFAAQDLPSMEKRVKQEAQSILGNCNLKIFGKLEDPTETKEFFDKHVGTSWVMESKGMTAPTHTVSSMFMTAPFYDDRGATAATTRNRASYDHLRTQREGEVHMIFAEYIVRARMFHAVPDRVKALRVHKMLPVEATNVTTIGRERVIHELAARLKSREWTAAAAAPPARSVPEVAALVEQLTAAKDAGLGLLEGSAAALVGLTTTLAATTKEPPPALPRKAAPSARAVPAGSNGNGAQSNADGFDPSIPRDEDGMPMLLDGDEFAIAELETYPQKQVVAQPGFVPTDLDMNIVTRPGTTEVIEDFDVLTQKLPPHVTTLLEKSAKKLNVGLTGDNKGEDRA